MMPLDHSTYCLACHKPMPEPAAVCPRCGAEQDKTRLRLLDPPPAGRGRRAPARPLNAVADAPCPSCYVRVPAGAPSCLYCGHPMLTDLPEWRSDSQDARPWAIGAATCTALGLAAFGMYAVWPPFALVGLTLITVALVCAAMAHGENPLGFGGTILIGLAIGAFLAGLGMLAGAIWAARRVGGP